MPQESADQIALFKAAVEAKIKALVSEFAEGKISREQFHLLYERYSARLAIAAHAEFSGNPDAVKIAQTGPPTVALKDATAGKIVGLLIYHNGQERKLETLGTFDIPMSLISPTLEDMTLQMLARQLLDHRLEKISDDRWLLFVPGKHTTVVVHFAHEPSAQQIRELERLQHDFEEANFSSLRAAHIDPNALAYPFLAFIKKKLGK